MDLSRARIHQTVERDIIVANKFLAEESFAERAGVKNRKAPIKRHMTSNVKTFDKT
jgi:hypothetical protein